MWHGTSLMMYQNSHVTDATDCTDNCTDTRHQTHDNNEQNKHTNTQHRIAPPVPNAPSSDPRNDADCGRNICGSAHLSSTAAARRRQYCCCMLRSAGGCRNGKLKNVSPPSVLFESSRFFYNTQETQTQKMMDQNFEIRIVIFENFFEIFKKASPDPSVADLDHHGRGQTRSA